MRRVTPSVVSALILSLAAGCGGGGSQGGTGGGGGGGGFRTTTEDARRQTATITPAGGTVSTTSSGGVSYTVTFPPGAVREGVAISATPISSLQGLALPGPVLAAVRLEPDGMALAQPVVLAVRGIPDGPAVGFHTTSDGKDLELVRLDVTGGEAQLVLHHFSPPGVAQGSLWSPTACASTVASRAQFDAQWAAAATSGTSQRSIALQRWALLDAYVMACPYGEGLLIDFDDAGQLAFGILEQWYDGTDGISDHLHAALLDPEPLLVAAMAEFHAWRDVAYGDTALVARLQDDQLLPLDDREEAAAVLVLRGIEAAVKGASTPPCAAADDAAALSWIDLADELVYGRYTVYATAVEWDGAPGPHELALEKACGIRQLAIRPAAQQIAIGEEFAFEAVALDPGGAEVPLPRAVSWSLVGDAATHLGEGAVRGVHEGSARLEAVVTAFTGTVLYSAEAELTVAVAGGVDVEPRSLTLRAGETATLTATVTDGSGQPLACPDLAWYSSDVGVADVEALTSTTAAVTAKTAGQANVSAVCGDALGHALVTVYDRITVAPAKACLAVGESIQLQALASGIPVTASAVWASSSGATSVSDGLVHALAEGRALVTATVGDLHASAVVDVTAVPLCGTWDFDVEEHGTSPDAYVESYPRVAVLSPGDTAGNFVADWGRGPVAIVVSGQSVTGLFVYPWDVYWICEVWTGTAAADGTIEASSTWDWHLTPDCGSANQEVGFSYYWGTLR